MANIQSERTLKMRQEFMELHQEGLNIKEIADHFDLSTGTVYALLDEIATAAGVSRESLLQRPHSAHCPHDYSRSAQCTPINLLDYQMHATETLVNIQQTITTVNQYIDAQENIQTKEVGSC